jgi:Fibronectin type III-like domain
MYGPRKGQVIDPTLHITASDVGHRSGGDVVQVYVRDPRSADEPPEQLCAFARVQLSPDESSVVQLLIPWAQLRVFRHGGFTLVPGDYGIGIGQSSADIRYQSDVSTTARRSLGGCVDRDRLRKAEHVIGIVGGLDRDQSRQVRPVIGVLPIRECRVDVVLVSA